MARVSVKVDYDDDRLRRNVDNYKEQFDRMLAAIVDYHSVAGVADMKTNAPWTDRTGAARNGLFTVVSHEPGHYTITLSHTVHYGFWLEVKFSGRDAVIMPTVLSRGRALMSDIQERLS